jgi:Uma2 family endonuclease
MNIQLRPPGLSYVTRAAEGMDRRRWTVAEIEAIVAAGILDEDERFELIDGEVVPMSPKGIRHEVVKGSVLKWWYPRMPIGVEIMQETTFRLSNASFLEPDFVFFASTTRLADLKPSNTLLAVEVADTSLRYDTGHKAKLYALHGLQELWTINAETLQTHVFTKPGDEGYLERRLIESTEILAPTFAPNLAIKLAELPLL